jgi:hypothetical protein
MSPDPRRIPGPTGSTPEDGPAHPTVRALLLMAGVVLAVILLAAVSTFGAR